MRGEPVQQNRPRDVLDSLAWNLNKSTEVSPVRVATALHLTVCRHRSHTFRFHLRKTPCSLGNQKPHRCKNALDWRDLKTGASLSYFRNQLRRNKRTGVLGQ